MLLISDRITLSISLASTFVKYVLILSFIIEIIIDLYADDVEFCFIISISSCKFTIFSLLIVDIYSMIINLLSLSSPILSIKRNISANFLELNPSSFKNAILTTILTYANFNSSDISVTGTN